MKVSSTAGKDKAFQNKYGLDSGALMVGKDARI